MVKKLLEWIYSGDIILPSDMEQVIKLAELSQKFLVDDLTSRWQEDIINHTNTENITKILCDHCVSNHEKSNYVLSETTLDHCKSFFLSEFPEIQLSDNKVEERIWKVPGLVTALLTHKVEHKQNSKKESKVTFSLSQNEVHSRPAAEER